MLQKFQKFHQFKRKVKRCEEMGGKAGGLEVPPSVRETGQGRPQCLGLNV